MRQRDPARLVAGVLRLLELEDKGGDTFFSQPTGGSDFRLFGGQVMAQALRAAMATVADDRLAHSLHAYFLRQGNPQLPITYAVERLRDGGSFSTRTLIARQADKPIFSMSASFQTEEQGWEHQLEMAAYPAPETLRSETVIREEQIAGTGLPEDFLLAHIPVDLRPVQERRYIDPQPSPGRQEFWFKPLVPLPDDPQLHRIFLAYVSDFLLLSTVLLPHGVHWATTKMQSATIDHSLWLHAQPDLGDWMLYAQEAAWTGQGRGLARGMIYSRDGRLIASMAQEGLIRPLPPEG